MTTKQRNTARRAAAAPPIVTAPSESPAVNEQELDRLLNGDSMPTETPTPDQAQFANILQEMRARDAAQAVQAPQPPSSAPEQAPAVAAPAARPKRGAMAAAQAELERQQRAAQAPEPPQVAQQEPEQSQEPAQAPQPTQEPPGAAEPPEEQLQPAQLAAPVSAAPVASGAAVSPASGAPEQAPARALVDDLLEARVTQVQTTPDTASEQTPEQEPPQAPEIDPYDIGSKNGAELIEFARKYGLFTEDQELMLSAVEPLIAAGKLTHDRVWSNMRVPELESLIQDKLNDLKRSAPLIEFYTIKKNAQRRRLIDALFAQEKQALLEFRQERGYDANADPSAPFHMVPPEYYPPTCETGAEHRASIEQIRRETSAPTMRTQTRARSNSNNGASSTSNGSTGATDGRRNKTKFNTYGVFSFLARKSGSAGNFWYTGINRQERSVNYRIDNDVKSPTHDRLLVRNPATNKWEAVKNLSLGVNEGPTMHNMMAAAGSAAFNFPDQSFFKLPLEWLIEWGLSAEDCIDTYVQQRGDGTKVTMGRIYGKPLHDALIARGLVPPAV